MTKKSCSSILFLSLAGQIAWAVENQFFNTFMYDKIIPNPMYVSVMVAFSAVVATLTSITMGSYSDGIGKRKPFLVLGFLIWGVSIVFIPGAAFIKSVILAAWVLILLDGVMTFFGSMSYDAVFMAYVTDITTVENRGRAHGVIELATWLAMLLTYGAGGMIIDAFGYFHFFAGVGVLVFIFGCAGSLLVKDTYAESFTPGRMNQDRGIIKRITETFGRESLRRHKTFFLVLLSMGLWGMAFNIFFPFLLIYMNHFLKVPIETSSILIAAVILAGGLAAAIPSGYLADRFGRKKTAVGAVILEAAGLLLFAMARDIVPLGIFASLWIAAMTAWTVATGSWSKDLFPEEKRGEFSGYVILFNVAFTMVPGPLIGGYIANTWGIKTVLNNQPAIIPTPLIFMVSAAMILTAMVPVLFCRETKSTTAG